ncbi:MAG TPA: hypothetical protein VET48_11980, partial [Steroidobacteraceae bacterium]|nr:hypothetical protein [Steroidobacteraceae bacterium]
YGLCYTDTKSSYNVNTSAFLILDTLLAALKQQGIYVFLTLHSEHSFSAADGIMHSDSGFVAPNGWFKQFYDARTAELYRQWSKSLLGHTNVVTKLRYADDPVIAGIEIDNQEYSFSLGWRNNYLNFKDSANIYPNGSATITFSESRKLDTLFTDYLIRKYGSENAINAAYAGPMPSSANLIEDGSFEDIGSTAWSFAVANGTTGGVVNISPGIDSQYCLLVHIKTIGANAGYGDAVLTNTSLRLKLDSLYEITFWARIKYIPSAPVLRDTLYMVMYDLPNYGTTLAQFQPIDTSWKQYSMTFRGIGDDAQILNCFLGKHLCDVELDGFSVHRKQEFGLFPFEHAASKTITRVTFGSTNLVPYQRYRDLFLFYDSLQQVYYAQTAKCIRDTVGTTMMINNYEASYWASYLDTYENRTSDYLGGGGNYDYAYTRPGKPYADSTFICINRSMLGDTYNYFLGTTEALPLDGKPFVSSNFLTPYINQHNQEALPFLAAYGSLHDWDGIFISWFAEYAQELDTNHTFTTAFYSLAGNAALQASAPAASDMFRNFKITPSTINVTVTHTDENMLLTGMVNRFSTPYGVDGFLDPGIGTMFKLRQSFG